MRSIKMLGLAAIAAMAVMAFVGASSASATIICKEDNTGVCAKPMTETSSVEGTASGPFLEVSATEKITCKSSKLTTKVTTAGAGSEGNTTWSECSNTVSGCSGSATTVNTAANRTGSVSWTEAHKFSVVTNNPETTVKMTCFGIPVSCTYKPATITGAGTNATSEAGKATIVINEKIASPGFPCPAGTEHATYTVTNPSNKLAGHVGQFDVAKE